ncbi:MAG: alpha/beta fold hydrolase [Oricola sp.]
MSGVAWDGVSSGKAGEGDTRENALAAAAQAIADLDLAARRVVVDTAEGFATWREWGRGPAIVLLHGGAGSWMHFFRQIPYLAGNYRVVAPDIPGFGDSSESRSEAVPEVMARILATGIERLVGDGAFFLVGFSFGGIIGGYLARLMQPRITGYVLVGGVGFEAPTRSVSLSRWRHLGDAAERRAVHRRNLAALMIADPDRIDDTAILIQEANAGNSRHDTRPIAHSMPLTRVLDESDVPLAAIWGARDHLAAPAFDERRAWLAERDPHAPFKLVPDAGHWVQYEAPDAFNEMLTECLSSFDGRRRIRRRPLQGGEHGR